MRKGQIFEFKSKTFGLKYPNNIAVCLGTSKKGKKHLIVAFTLKGKQHMRPEYVTKKKLGYPDLDEELYDSATLKEKLGNIIRKVRGGKGRKRTSQGRKKHIGKGRKIVAKGTTAKDIWLGLNEDEILTVEEITSHFLDTKGPTSAQIEKIRERVMESIEEGLPYFRIGRKNRKRIHLLSHDEYHMIKDEMNLFRELFENMEEFKKERTTKIFPSSSPHDLSPAELQEVFLDFLKETSERQKLQSIQSLSHPNGPGGIDTKKLQEMRFQNENEMRPDSKLVIRQIGSANQENILLKLCREMEEFVKFDQWREDMGIGIEGITRLDDFDLKKFIPKIAASVTCLKKSSLTTMFTTFLIIIGYWTIEKAVMVYIERFINTGVFDFRLGYPNIFNEKVILERAESMSMGSLYGIDDNRRDLRELFTVTVDPVDAKDFDDAISIIEKGDETVLYVHIADVSHYVSRDSMLDSEAFHRCTSVYLPNMVLPMLPEILSNDLCSLRSGVDRFAVTTKMIFDGNLELNDFEIFPSVIRVDRNLSYEEVLEHFGNNREPYSNWIKLSDRLRTLRDQLELKTSEMKIHMEGNRLDRKLKRENPATQMIECFMVTTNEVVAMYLTAFTESVVYRIHGLPDSVGFEKYNEIIQRLELNLQTFDEEIIRHEERKITEDWFGRADDKGISFGNIAIRYDKGIDENLKRSIGILDKNKDDEKKRDTLLSGNLEAQADGIDSAESVRSGKNEFYAEFRKKLRANLLGVDSYEKLVEAKEILREELNKKIDLKRRDYLLKCLNVVLNSVNEGVEESELRELLNIIILKTLQLAVYSTENIGHFGLGSNCYLHFTSPIRRYADLIVHRVLKSIFEYTNSDLENGSGKENATEYINRNPNERGEEEGDMEGADEELKRPTEKEFDSNYTKEKIDEICERCSEQSRDADRFERKVNDISICLDRIFHNQFWGRKQVGIITETIPRGVFLTTGDGIEGFISTKNISRYETGFNDERDGTGGEDIPFENRSGAKEHRGRGRKKRKKKLGGKDKIRLGIGEKVLVTPKRFSIERGRIEMKLIKIL